jgi:hypothetical protein
MNLMVNYYSFIDLIDDDPPSTQTLSLLGSARVTQYVPASPM